MGERADGKIISSGGRHFACDVERNPTRYFHESTAFDHRNRLANLSRRHVVQQNDIGVACERFANLCERLRLDNGAKAMRSTLTRQPTRIGDASSVRAKERQVIVLD